MGIKKVDISQIKYTPLEGEIVQDANSGNFMIYHEGVWKSLTVEGGGIEMGLYDMNKQIIGQLPDFTDWDWAVDLIEVFHNTWNNEYYMLYGKEISYFTLFKMNDESALPAILLECINNIGPAKAIDLTETQDALEIWVMSNNEPTCLYFFPYDMGLVMVGE
jgi:hypothetical protein